MKLDSSIEEAIVSVVESLGFECYEVRYFNAGGKTVLRIFADSETGISMDECAEISHGISEMLDEKEFGKKEYTLEVSSPGLDRPLTNQRDFKRFTGKDVQIRYNNEQGKAKKFVGKVVSTTETEVTLEADEKEETFLYASLLNGKVKI
jgi:ribosome maturation factor RimP